MAKAIYQYKVNSAGDIPLENRRPVVALGIQGPAGTVFSINNGDDIQIGQYGIYELDLSGGLGLIQTIKIVEPPTDTVIVDTIYDITEGGVL